jgi:Flp pilus assembly pilin Flp
MVVDRWILTTVELGLLPAIISLVRVANLAGTMQ